MQSVNHDFGALANPFANNPFIYVGGNQGSPPPPPPTEFSILVTSDGNWIVTKDGNGMVMTNVL